jgi:hypothetical protein
MPSIILLSAEKTDTYVHTLCVCVCVREREREG